MNNKNRGKTQSLKKRDKCQSLLKIVLSTKVFEMTYKCFFNKNKLLSVDQYCDKLILKKSTILNNWSSGF